MANSGKILDGLTILVEHNGRDDYMQAEHDELYAGNKPDPGSEDGKKLLELGWNWDEGLGCWSVFT